MAAIEKLIQGVTDPVLRGQLLAEVDHFKATKIFGLVFESHSPELLRVPGIAAKLGTRVVKVDDTESVIYRVTSEVNGNRLKMIPVSGGPEETVDRSSVVVTRAFGEPMYPALMQVDSIEQSPGKPYHVFINSDNYHALQLLMYGYRGKVDAIYIDPPYNTGSRDWKYNNRYVDKDDGWRHSKWISIMRKRLVLARSLLSPSGVLIVTIDEHEVHHLALLLEQEFDGFYRQMVTVVTNPKGVTQDRFSRVEEYAIFCFSKGVVVGAQPDDLLTPLTGEEANLEPRWKGLLRSGDDSRREDRDNMFYPVLIDTDRGAVVGTGDPLPLEQQPVFGEKIEGFDVAWPVRKDGSLGRWGVGHTTLRRLIRLGYVAAGRYDRKRMTYGLTYLSERHQDQIQAGMLLITGQDEEKNVVRVRYADPSTRRVRTVWHRTSHDAGGFGSDLVKKLIGGERAFSFPKSLYSVRDALSVVCADRPDAIIIDFFAGSGTSLHATAVMNQLDGGKRRCIMVTNNEVGEEAELRLLGQGFSPGSRDFEKYGIAETVTWPRVKACLSGHRADGSLVPGEYMDGRQISAGFEENAAYFKLDFLDPGAVSRGDEFESIIPILWMMSGCQGPCGRGRGNGDWYMPKENIFAVLINEDAYGEFLEKVRERPNIDHISLVTDSTAEFQEMALGFGRSRKCVQLYRSYIETFRINLAEPSVAPSALGQREGERAI